MGLAASAAETFHRHFVLDERAAVLAAYIVPLLPPGANILDVGAGDGKVSRAIIERSRSARVTGVDTFVRRETAIHVEHCDGTTLPFEDNAFDVAMAVDVLHHSLHAELLLKEMKRVARLIVIKDHLAHGPFSRAQLRVMDWVGNDSKGVKLPCNYLNLEQWEKTWNRVGLRIESIETRMKLYRPPIGFLANRGLHLLASLSTDNASA